MTLSEEQVDAEFTVATALRFMQRQHDDLVTLMEAQFRDQNTALALALTNSKDSIRDALLAVKESNDKAERDTEKRFEATNEWRASLNDLISNTMPRAEADSNRESLTKKLDEHTTRADQRLAAIDAVLAHSGGAVEGGLAQHTETRLNNGLLIAAATLLLGLIGTVITLVVLMNK